jgi:ABC-type phosphate transport system substrate-binding protein
MENHKALSSILTAFAMLALVLGLAPAAKAGEAIVIIVNSANPVESLSVSDLKKLFLSDKGRWDTGKAVAPVMLGPGQPERSAFLKAVCGMSDGDLNKYFMQAAFSGKSATPPKEVGSTRDIKSVVSASPGAIGFIKASDFSPADSGLKAIKVEGVTAADPAYKLKM